MGSFVLLFVGLLAVVAGLARGPVSLGFIAPYVEQTFESQYPDINLDFTDLELEWSARDKNLAVVVNDLVISKVGHRVASIPDVSVIFSGAALLRGQIAPSELEFTGLKMRLTRTQDGEVKFGYEYSLTREAELKDDSDQDQDEAAKELFLAIFDELSEEPDKNTVTGYLKRLEFYNSSIFVEDEILGKFWRAVDVDLMLWRENEGLHAQANGGVKVGAEIVSVFVLADYDRQTQLISIDGQFDDLPLFLLANQSPELGALSGANIAASGRINLDMNRQFGVGDIGFDLKLGTGTIDLPDLYKQPLELDSAVISGSLSSEFDSIKFDNVTVKTMGASLNMTGSLSLSDAGIGMQIKGGAANFQVNNLGLFWPYSMATDGYDWVTTKMRDGVIPSADFDINIPVGAIESGNIPEGAVRLSFDVKGVSTNYYAPLPKVTNIAGKGVLTESQVRLTALTGSLGELRVTSDDVLIYGFDKDVQWADINVHVEGDSRDIFAFLDHEPLGFATPYGIVPSRMTGKGVVDASFKFPLLDDLTMAKLDFDAVGDFKGAFIPDVADDTDLSDADLHVEVNPKGFDISGTAKLRNIPFNLQAQSWFVGDRAGYRVYNLEGTIDNDGRRSLGVETDIVDGPMDIVAKIEIRPDGGKSGNISADLTAAKLELSPLHWSKKAGEKGRMTANITIGEGEITRLTDIKISAG
ncbi:MAG: hypothetical protein COB93_08995, partial [Sneathiella sp.]